MRRSPRALRNPVRPAGSQERRRAERVREDGGEDRHPNATPRRSWVEPARAGDPGAGYTHPVGFGSPAYRHACLAGP